MKHPNDTTTRRISGSGGAHIGFAMFGARGPLLDEQDGGGSGGQQPKPGDKPSDKGGDDKAPKKDDAGGEDKVFTQADLDREIQKRLDRERRKYERSEPEDEKRGKKNHKPDNTDSSWMFDFSDAYDAIVDERGAKPTRGMKQKMRAAFERERPSDPDGWIEEWFDDAGLVKKQSDSTTSQQQQQPKKDEPASQETKKREGPPLSDKGAASSATRDPEAVLLNDLEKITKGDIARLRSKHGAEKANEMIADATRRYLETIKLVPDRRR